jgi:hypothetical protein
VLIVHGAAEDLGSPADIPSVVAALAEYDRPVGIGALVTVDTTVTVDVNAVASAVRDCYDHAY